MLQAWPVHSSFRELVESSIYYDIICGKLKDGCKRADVYVNPREVSKAVGNKRCNIIKLKQEKNIDVKICSTSGKFGKKRGEMYLYCKRTRTARF